MRRIRGLIDTYLISPKKRLIKVKMKDCNTFQIHGDLLQKGRESCMRQRERIEVGHWDKCTNAKIVNQWDRLRMHFLFIIRSLYR